MLDTNVCIAIVRKRSEAALRRLRGKSVGQVGISSITLAELEFGVARSSRPDEARAALDEFLLPLEIAGFDEACASSYGTVRSRLETRGKPVGPLDTLIAAHALSMHAILVTNNRREFDRVEGLAVEDWTS